MSYLMSKGEGGITITRGAKEYQPNPRPGFRELFEAHYPGVYRRLAYLLGDLATAEDLAQEAFLKLYLSAPNDLVNPVGWLARVATNLAYNYLEREKQRPYRELACRETEGHEGAGTSASPEELVLRNHDVVLVRRLLQQLSPRDRVVLLLRHAGYSYAEIAGELGVERSSVGTILARAQRRFREVYLSWKGGKGDVL